MIYPFILIEQSNIKFGSCIDTVHQRTDSLVEYKILIVRSLKYFLFPFQTIWFFPVNLESYQRLQ